MWSLTCQMQTMPFRCICWHRFQYMRYCYRVIWTGLLISRISHIIRRWDLILIKTHKLSFIWVRVATNVSFFLLQTTQQRFGLRVALVLAISVDLWKLYSKIFSDFQNRSANRVIWLENDLSFLLHLSASSQLSFLGASKINDSTKTRRFYFFVLSFSTRSNLNLFRHF